MAGERKKHGKSIEEMKYDLVEAMAEEMLIARTFFRHWLNNEPVAQEAKSWPKAMAKTGRAMNRLGSSRTPA